MKKQVLFFGLLLSVLAMHAGRRWRPGVNYSNLMSEIEEKEKEGVDQVTHNFIAHPGVSKELKAAVASWLFSQNSMGLWLSAVSAAGAETPDGAGETPIHYILRTYAGSQKKSTESQKSIDALNALADKVDTPSELMTIKDQKKETGLDIVRAMAKRDCSSADRQELNRPAGFFEWLSGAEKDVSPQCADMVAFLNFMEGKKLIENKSSILD